MIEETEQNTQEKSDVEASKKSSLSQRRYESEEQSNSSPNQNNSDSLDKHNNPPMSQRETKAIPNAWKQETDLLSLNL